ncbi:MAG: hypothetical protein ABSA45_06215 [Verrucomicrobiota bacterium]
MKSGLSNFAARLRELISNRQSAIGNRQFSALALELFTLQFKHNAAYRKICEARDLTPENVEDWTQIPAVPTAAFKELPLTCLPPNERTFVFHSSGTTERWPSRHFHNAESLKIYETSLLPWFFENVLLNLRFTKYDLRLICLTPKPSQAPHSSLIHMFETVRQKLGAPETAFVGKIAANDSWTLDFDAALAALSPKSRTREPRPHVLLGTAFSFVHLLDFLAERNSRFDLPAGSRVMETGGYKNRSRSMPKAELHALITERLGVPPENIVCEYGMSELSSQAYDTKLERRSPTRRDAVGIQAFACSDGTLKRELQRAGSETGVPAGWRRFRFPPLARVQIISPGTGREVAEGETGLIRVFDLANVFSVMAVQTEDLGVRRGDGFELIGRAQFAEPRGCSLMTHSAFLTPHSAIR